MYLTERVIIGLVWLTCLVSLWFIPKNKRREASVIFLIAQMYAWIFGLIVVELGLIEYPVREMHKANSTSFSFEYLVLPFICIFFNLKYPDKKSVYKKLLYYIGILGLFTFIEHIAEKYTRILQYNHWEWYYTFITMCFVLYIVRVIYKWYFKLKNPLSL